MRGLSLHVLREVPWALPWLGYSPPASRTVSQFSCPSKTAGFYATACSGTCDLATGELIPEPDLIHFPPSLVWWLTAVCHSEGNPSACVNLQT